jgi:hypothetical protein
MSKAVCAVCEHDIRDAQAFVSIDITHEEQHWTAVDEPTVLAHSVCLDDLELTITAATTAFEGDNDT